MASKEELVVSNSYVYNHYQDGKEANYFLSTDRINAVAVLPLNKVHTPLLLPGFSSFLILYSWSYIGSMRAIPIKTGTQFDSVARMPRWEHLFPEGLVCTTPTAY